MRKISLCGPAAIYDVSYQLPERRSEPTDSYKESQKKEEVTTDEKGWDEEELAARDLGLDGYWPVSTKFKSELFWQQGQKWKYDCYMGV